MRPDGGAVTAGALLRGSCAGAVGYGPSWCGVVRGRDECAPNRGAQALVVAASRLVAA
jgi:hypothetical protein